MALAGIAAGCSSGESGTASRDSAAVGRERAPEAVPGESAPRAGAPGESGAKPQRPADAEQGAPPAQAAPPVPVAVRDRQLSRKANLTVTAPDVLAAADRARSLAAAAGGYTGSERIGGNSAALEVIVPGDRLDATLTELSGLGEVKSREQTVEDVTEQVVDVDSRIASQQASVARVRGMLDRATSISELGSVEQELTSRESELESLQARKNALAGQVSTSTISLSLRAPGAPAQEPDDDGIAAGFADGWGAFLDFGGGLLRALAAVSPFLLLFGGPVAAFGWWLRRRRRGTAVPAAVASGD
ncbi:hypothetical protein CFN78_00390 [Amycolatopsis antarctica]|uniref:DUF4349 domain-containing protein n=2 Tax=Amycolatopsis antarctica TaxID=1854586 RepID=A0A263DB64_9PSEU|nr:hypothetical protein CFN78_00390 [Amycolatopsis antarctica]